MPGECYSSSTTDLWGFTLISQWSADVDQASITFEGFTVTQ